MRDVPALGPAIDRARVAVNALADVEQRERLAAALAALEQLRAALVRDPADPSLETIVRTAMARLDAVRSASTDRCPAAAEVRAIESNARALVIRTTAPIPAELTTGRQSGDELPAAIPTVTLELPNASLAGVAARTEWPAGPFLSMRATRYRADGACGIRLRLEPRVSGHWRLVTAPNRLVITTDLLPPGADGDAITGSALLPGMVTISASAARSESSRPDTASTPSGFVAVGFAEGLPSGAIVRGFLSQVSPRATGSPFGAVGVSALPLGAHLLHAAAGDLLVTIGDTGSGDLSGITSTLFRGAALGVEISPAIVVQAFGGRAASASLARLGSAGTFRPGARDRLAGVQASLLPADAPYAMAAGGTFTDTPQDGPRTLNLFQAFEYRRSPVLRIRLLLEQSRAFDTSETGQAWTIQARAVTRAVSLDGYYRALSDRFRPVGGSGYYASLRRGYGFAGSYRHESLTLNASASQAKVFSVLDPEEIGTFTTSHAASAGYSLSSRFSLQASYGRSAIESDPGARIPADSISRQIGAGLGFAIGEFNGSMQAIRSETENEASPALDFVSDRLDLDLRSAYWRDIHGRFSVARSRRADGSSAGADYRASLGAPLADIGRWSVSGEVGASVIPAGVAQSSLRQTFASMRVNPNGSTWISGGLQLTYERIKIGDEEFDVFHASIATQKTLRWGQGVLLAAPVETRALRLQEPRPARASTKRAAVRVIVFEDRDQSGKREPDEKLVGQAFVEIDRRRYRIDGATTVPVDPGPLTIRLLPRGDVLGRYALTTEQSVRARIDESLEVFFPVQPAGRLHGRVEAAGVEAQLLAGLIVRASGPVHRQTVTDGAGDFDFGQLPEGDYRLEFVADQLRSRALIEDGASPAAVRVGSSLREKTVLRLRRATARERFGS
jgi:hypothetical protein